MTNGDKPQVWTTWCAHSNASQGVTYAVNVSYASDVADALSQFSALFGTELSNDADCAQGIVCNGVTRKIFSEEAFATLRKAEEAHSLSAHATIHLHYR